MRRNRRNLKKLKIIFFISLFIMITGISYSYLSTSLSIRGNVSGSYLNDKYVIDPTSSANLTISDPTITRWMESGLYYYQYTLTLSNTSNSDYKHFKVIFTFNNNINVISVLNHEYTLNSNILTILHLNYVFKKKTSVEIKFTISSNSPTLNLTKMKLEVSNGADETSPNAFNVVFNKTADLGNSIYQYDVTVTNLTSKTTKSWQLDITLPEGTSYVSGTNANFSTRGNVLTIKNIGSNAKIPNNGSATFTLQLRTNIINFIPTDMIIIVK